MQGILSHLSHHGTGAGPSVQPQGVLRLCLRLAAAAAGLDAAAIAAPGRRWGEAAQARHLAVYLAHVACGLSQRRVAQALGCHVSSICYGLRRIEDARDTPAFDRLLTLLEREVRTLQSGRPA